MKKTFLLMNKQLSGSPRLMIKLVRLVVFGNIAVNKPQFSVFDSGVRIGNVAMAVSETFDFASPQDDSTFQLRRDVKFVPGAAVFRHVFECGIFGRSLFFLLLFSHDSSSLRRVRSSRRDANDRILRACSRETVYDNWARLFVWSDFLIRIEDKPVCLTNELSVRRLSCRIRNENYISA